MIKEFCKKFSHKHAFARLYVCVKHALVKETR